MSEFVIYIRLLNEGSPTARPTHAEMIGENIFRVLANENYDPEDETWEFTPGTVVRCAREIWSEKEILLAVEKI